MSSTETVIEEAENRSPDSSVVSESSAEEKPARRTYRRKTATKPAEESAASDTSSSPDSAKEESRQERPAGRARRRKATDRPAGESASPSADSSRSDSDEQAGTPSEEGRYSKRGKGRNGKRNEQRGEQRGGRKRKFEQEEEPISDEFAGVTLHLRDVSEMTPAALLEKADSLGIDNVAGMRKQEQVSAILRAHALRGGTIHSEGVLEILPDGFGFLRSADANYLAGPDDVYVSIHQVRKFFLRKGDTIAGEIRPPRRGERYFALKTVDAINGEVPENARTKVLFDNLTPLYPDERLHMEIENPTNKDMTGRIIDLVSPIGKGQRGLLVAPPRTGKTMMMQSIAHSD